MTQNGTDEPISFEWQPITGEAMGALLSATHSAPGQVPLTFGTIYRWGEFEWLKRHGVDLRQLLHTEQEYEYLAPLKVGSTPKITTRLKTKRFRADVTFVTLESEICCDGVVCVRATTQFFVKGTVGEQP